MSNAYMELVRRDCEEVEVLERIVCDKLADRENGNTSIEGKAKQKRRPKTHSSMLQHDHLLSAGLTAAIDRVKQFQHVSEKRLEREVDEINAGGLDSFYSSYRRIKEANNSRKSEVAPVLSEVRTGTLVERPLLSSLQRKVRESMTFSGEEWVGRFLDVHNYYNRYINLFSKEDKLGQIGYLEYLDRMGLFMSIDVARIKTKDEYRNYIGDLLKYLQNFHMRAQPLVDVNVEKAQKQFEDQWSQGKVPGWDVRFPDDSIVIRVGYTAEKLVETLNGEGLKKELLYRGLKCGGRPIDRANRLLKCLQFRAESKGEVYPKKQRLGKAFCPKKLAQSEMLIQFYVEQLGEFVDATKARVIKKQTLSHEELQQELEAEEALGEIDLDELDNDDDDEQILSNPLNLPLGWDGKPIPFWLYKLHGLGIEYKCEICGNYSYWGRRAFDRHFQEWRHAHGMRMLGVPNTKHFHDIVKIEDAQNLYKKLKSTVESEFQFAEEFETKAGVKVDKKTYEFLKRQGLE
mmetsp:Transcript_1681/g.2031  ORF Transcript_1681/g.2031 Transcript_1681/m.2031 type:complete len:516 (-) Transcript_1681:575-2122(-)|eukprot:CAMPEP_0184024700 /NCGR_PEP_ID=MMETSP0954-20121128/12281_1 /TAXON_ID=627963 /ORGANISM="Aplanochytrium sp, Strain PBS07" /LENGTH=515 /DNA_ID=CAMNT_0026308163 /DNA_START=105 /DNA_END=1652 /DNA_ORIENTATION=+